MNVQLQFEPLDCSFSDWPNYAVQPPGSSPPPPESKNNTQSCDSQNDRADTKKQKLMIRSLHATDELLQTERDYTSHLRHLVKVVFGQILQRQKWIQDTHKDTIVRNANELLNFHNGLLLALEQACQSKDIRSRCSNIATVFLDMGSSFTLYDTYCDKHDAAIALCNNYRSKPEWSAFAKDCIATPTLCSDPGLDQGTKPLHFEDYLIKPVQRVCRYQLLLKEILRSMPPDSAEYTQLDCALGLMQTVVADIDRRKYHRDTVERTRLFMDRLDLSSSDGQLSKDSLYSLGNLVMAGVIDITYSSFGQTVPASSSRSKYLGCFIFSTYILMVRPKKVTCYSLKHWFPLRLSELEDLQDINDQRENAFLVRCKKHCFVFTATCQREKRLWTTKLSQAISTAKSQPKSAENFIGSSLQGIAKPTKLRTSRSVTNLLDFYRDGPTCSSSLCSASTSWLHHQHSSVEKQQQQSLVENTSLRHHDNTIRRSKSLGLQLASYYDDPRLSSSSPPESPNLALFGQPLHQRHDTEHPPPPPPIPLSLPPTKSAAPTTMLTKRHSADFMPRTKKREQLKSRIHSEMYVKPIELSHEGSSSSTKPQQLRSGSMDLMSTSSSQSSLNMIGKIKSNHQHAMRIGADHKLKEVCTQDYLASRSWSTLLRESSNGQSSFNNNSGSHGNTSSNAIAAGSTPSDHRGHRKSSLSNLRSSSSSFMLMGKDPSRRISNGSSNQSATRSSKEELLGDANAETTFSAAPLDQISKQGSRSPQPRHQPWKPRSAKRVSSSSTLSSSTSSSGSSSSSTTSCMAPIHRKVIPHSPTKRTAKTRMTNPSISSHGSYDFQQYYRAKFDGDRVTKDLLPTMTAPRRPQDDGNQGLLYSAQKKKPLRSSMSSYSLHIQPMTSNVKHAFVDGFRRLSPSAKQQQQQHHDYNNTKDGRYCGSFACTASTGSDHFHIPTQGPNVVKRSSRIFSWIRNDEDDLPPLAKKNPPLSCHQSRSAILSTMVDSRTTAMQPPSKPNWSRKWMLSRK